MVEIAITSVWRTARSLAAAAALALALAGCAEEAPITAADAGADTLPPDPCGGKCDSAQLCVQGSEGEYGCAMICFNQLHCWSGCCVPLDGTPYNVCRPTNVCFP
jgi:hypothetical protein